MKPQKSLWGFGVADSYRCLKNRRLLDGTKKVRSHLFLEIFVNEKNISFFLSARKKRTAKTRVFFAELHLYFQGEIEKALKDPLVSQLIATKLLDQSPISLKVVLDDNRTFSLKGSYSLPPPEELDVFSYAPYKSYLSPDHYFLLQGSKAEGPDENETSILFKPLFIDPLLAPKKVFFARSSEERGSNTLTLKNLLNDKLKPYGTKVVERAFLGATIPGGYAGFRYGYPATTNEDITGKLPMVSIFTEIKSGLLEGLKWYWDFGPEARSIENNQFFSFTWSRATLGYSFYLDVKDAYGFSFALDLTPKIGFMDLEGNLPAPNQFGYISSAKYSVENAFNSGIELGIMATTKWFLARGWLATDLAGSLPIGNQNVKIKSSRAGIDSYFDLFTLWQYFEFSLLVFGAFETIAIEKDFDPEDDRAPRNIAYQNAFIGSGATIQW